MKSKSEEWDEKEKKQPTHEIDFRGDHIHDMKNNKCKICNKRRDEILK